MQRHGEWLLPDSIESLGLAARWLPIGRAADPTPALMAAIHALRQLVGEIVDDTVQPGSRVDGQPRRFLQRLDAAAGTRP